MSHPMTLGDGAKQRADSTGGKYSTPFSCTQDILAPHCIREWAAIQFPPRIATARQKAEPQSC